MWPLFSVRAGGLQVAGRTLLKDLHLDIPDGATTVLLGPGGAGKSALLRTLSGEPPAAGWELQGEWLVRGKPVAACRDRLRSEVAFCRQQPNRWSLAADRHSRARAAAAPPPPAAALLAGGAPILLLDEPRLPAGEHAQALAEALRRRPPGSTVVLVTHDVEMARAAGDFAILLCEGQLAAAGRADRFFAQPPNAIAARFVAQGNCCLTGPAMRLPSHFRWVLPGRLAGMGRPGLLDDASRDIAALAGSGVTLLVSLAERPPATEPLRDAGIELRHFPIPDMGVPAVGPMARLCRDVARAMAGGTVVLQCHAGLGRTGLGLASVLVWLGVAPAEAILRLRTLRGGYLQNAAQERFVHRFAESLPPAAGTPAQGEAP